VQHGVHKRGAPCVSDNLRTEHDVAELARNSRRQRITAVDREGERICFLVDPEMLALEIADLVRADELKTELAVPDSLSLQNLADHVPRGPEVECRAGTVRHLDLHHRYFRRAVPVSSACSL
jgi:hypothetical protein